MPTIASYEWSGTSVYDDRALAYAVDDKGYIIFDGSSCSD